MPAILRLKFKLSEPISNPTPSEVHGIYLRLLPEEITGRIHDLKKKPFSLWILSADSQSLELRLGVLDDELIPIIFYEYYTQEKDLYLRSAKVMTIKPYGIKQEKARTYEELLNTKPLKNICLEFLKPTSFRRYRWDYILPNPVLIFKNLLTRWNSFSKHQLNIKNLEEELAKKVGIKALELHSTNHTIGSNITFRGFLGIVCYTTEDPELAKTLSVLARFAEYAGVGQKTTMDMGMVKLHRM
ncbi:CRISPR system precrRNA processing endoribonuclease RAMP protein Cas6 [Hydrogenobacter hydrogenophilus]|uniref:CRISPR-associated endoribonuclease Cas6 n=1 Tax=Hydrogenobacter hydrogenophilus TaxID=35835 RepID=A0A285NX24_9AQUI|nr:CRISPR system precrRNA processing endoribonuclease RAMP protein Cas6 [Hydrogenobacter hydrogenophilus]SNZ14035.1 CRISPR-associated endoribonuclease Cas6 [Hydrogenobacter hydrogenophilus]